ncbi:MAG TPA: hypothetical protein IGS52_15655 [Oscillatoriaceae cyanobacterium M33_DOE_052]|uniref:DUF2281 domain-containing protein n=1 Tax=Planktothricoides sp. SpSt-374 TaxID=2282167 RepID=A0A7C3VEG3_9CYAN|nr:hypothetical protein [Oscillatoriaceae cyanobacterium M33_DOE_052]
MTSNITAAELKQIIFDLPLDDLIALDAEISEQIASKAMMQLAETGFQEWNELEEDIYQFLGEKEFSRQS